MFATPELRWQGQEVFLIGGGPSLRSFDFGRLRGRNTIGCNMAYKHGPEICQVCLFSDPPFFNDNRFALERYVAQGGELWGIARDLYPRAEQLRGFVKLANRKPRGLWPASLGLGFGGHSAPAAVNLALQMGAATVFLLGCDCKRPPGQSNNWHDDYKDKIAGDEIQLFRKFQEGWQSVATDLPVRFPRRRIINLGPDSALDLFPKEELDQWLSVPAMR